MTKSRVIKVLCASLFFALVLGIYNAKATTFYSIETRINQNNKMLDSANRMGSIYRSSYTDPSLKDLAETNYEGFTSAQQYVINTLANTILGSDSNLTQTGKLEKFYNWIVDNFYYYENPERIIDLSKNNRADNPYYLLTYEYELTGKVRARNKGYAATLIALARTQGISARMVAGHYNSRVRDNYSEWDYNVTETQINHIWVEAYVDGSWKMFDPVADSYKKYNEVTEEYIDNLNTSQEDEGGAAIVGSSEMFGLGETNSTEDESDLTPTNDETNQPNNEIPTEYVNRYFAPSVENLSKTHVGFKTYFGSNNMKYVSCTSERNALKSFLSIKSNGTTNGKKINSSYNSNDSSTWISKTDGSSITNGYGRVKRLYWPMKKSITGNLRLDSFTALENISVSNNKLNSINLTGVKSLKTANFQYNNASKVIVKGSKKLYSLKAHGNPLTYAEYDFNGGKEKAVIKAATGGTFSVKYIKSNGVRKHYLTAKPKEGYAFVGWYKGAKRLTRNKTFNVVKNGTFTYVAKFEKKSAQPYIKISISKQKLWYYNKGVLKYTSSIVTGQRYTHDTPRGTFSIRGKARDVYLIGPDYKSFVNYWMPIYGEIGLHDATWRWTFGGDIYTYNGSHGCINLPLKTAKYIYNNVPTGTKVKVVD